MNKFSVILIACLSLKAFAADKVVKVDGSSSVFPISEAVAEEFQKSKKNEIKVTVGISGTGGGFKKFCRGETDVQDASRPILKEEIEICKAAKIQFYELPIAFDALAVVVNPKNKMDSIKVSDLKKMWEPAAQSKVMKWNQVNPEWPEAPLKLFGAGSDSGTFDYFTEAIVGKAKASRGDFTASEDDNTLVMGISTDKNALGYIPYSYYFSNQKKLKALAIDGGDKAPKKGAVKPSAETVKNGTYLPLSRPLFVYINAKSVEKSEVKEFVQFYQETAAKQSEHVGYVALPALAYKKNLEHFSKGKLGSVFKGVPEIGLTIEEIQKREATY